MVVFSLMRKTFTKTGKQICRIIDFFYPPFARYTSPLVFRYAACGITNVLFDWVLFWFVFNFVLQKQMIHLPFITFSSHAAALFITFPISTFTGFLLQKYVTFTTSYLRGHIQLFRYLLVVMSNLLINYVGLKLLVEGFHFYPTPSKMTITIITVVFSYLSQKKFTFK